MLNNAIDNRSFAADLASVSDAEIAALRASIDASENAVVGLFFCGSLYADKRLHMMLESCRRVVNRHPDFRLVVLGDGPPSRRDLQPAMGKPWFHWAGTQRGKEKAAWFKAANLLINPGAVGLHILDSFAAEIPLLTTKDAKHGPEISYLEDGISGIVTEGTVEAFASAIQQLIDQPERRASLGRQARTKAQSYTLDAMVESFVSGMDACLRMPRLH